jgi:hypothetical protein
MRAGEDTLTIWHPVTGEIPEHVVISKDTFEVFVPVVLPADPTAPLEAATKQYVDKSGLYRGTYSPATNVPDLAVVPTVDQYQWMVNLADPLVGEATIVDLPGIPLGTLMFEGDFINWSLSDAAYTYVGGGGISRPEADALYVKLAGDTMTGALNLPVVAKALNININGPAGAGEEVIVIRNDQYPPPGTSPAFAIRCHDNNPGLKITSRITSHGYGGTFETDFYVGSITSLPRIMMLRNGELYIDGAASGTAFNVRSSEALKRNIEAIDDANVMEGWQGLNPRRYWLKDPKNQQARSIGFVVEELEANDTLKFMVNGENEERGYDIAQVLALTVARVKQLEAELATVRRSA